MPYASFAAACRTLWNLSRASYFIPIQVSGPEFMLKISAREFMPTPDCVAVTKMRYVPRQGRRETKRGESNGNHLRVDQIFRFQAILGASRGYGDSGHGHGRMGGSADTRIRAR